MRRSRHASHRGVQGEKSPDTTWVSCGGKQMLTFAEASRKARGLRIYKDVVAAPYLCQRCKHFHVGTDALGRRKNERRPKTGKHKHQGDE